MQDAGEQAGRQAADQLLAGRQAGGRMFNCWLLLCCSVALLLRSLGSFATPGAKATRGLVSFHPGFPVAHQSVLSSYTITISTC